MALRGLGVNQFCTGQKGGLRLAPSVSPGCLLQDKTEEEHLMTVVHGLQLAAAIFTIVAVILQIAH